MKAIRINAPGDGDWIMDTCKGVFRPGVDHSLANHRDDELVGGFVLCQYLGNSIAVHDAGKDPHWCSRDLLWMMFHYAFRQLGCQKLVAPTPSDHYRALELNLRAGFRLETVVRDLMAPGQHLMVLTMEARNCRWLRLIPQSYSPGGGIPRKAA